MHYPEVRRGIYHPLTLRVSVPATASPRLSPGLTPSGTAELRRRIITFYADFNTRLRPPAPARPSRGRSRHPPSGFRIADSATSFHSSRCRTAPNSLSSPFYVALLFSRPARAAAITETRFLRRSIERTDGRTDALSAIGGSAHRAGFNTIIALDLDSARATGGAPSLAPSLLSQPTSRFPRHRL